MRYKRDWYNKVSERPERRRSLRAQVLKGVGCVNPPTATFQANRDLDAGVATAQRPDCPPSPPVSPLSNYFGGGSKRRDGVRCNPSVLLHLMAFYERPS
jgi:hypothetical protein